PAKSKRLMMGGVVVALLAALGSLAGWRLGWFGGSQKPKELLRQRLETPASAPTPPPPAPAASLMPQSSTPQFPAPAMSLGPVVTPPAPVERPAAVAPAAPPKPAAQPGSAPAAGARYAIEFGPFMTAPEAERVERQLSEAGYP